LIGAAYAIRNYIIHPKVMLEEEIIGDKIS